MGHEMAIRLHMGKQICLVLRFGWLARVCVWGGCFRLSFLVRILTNSMRVVSSLYYVAGQAAGRSKSIYHKPSAPILRLATRTHTSRIDGTSLPSPAVKVVRVCRSNWVAFVHPRLPQPHSWLLKRKGVWTLRRQRAGRTNVSVGSKMAQDD